MKSLCANFILRDVSCSHLPDYMRQGSYYPYGNNPSFVLDSAIGGPQVQSGQCGREKDHCGCWKVFCHLGHCLVAIKILKAVFVLLMKKHVQFIFFIMLYSDIIGVWRVLIPIWSVVHFSTWILKHYKDRIPLLHKLIRRSSEFWYILLLK
jgi:hypothetical protein